MRTRHLLERAFNSFVAAAPSISSIDKSITTTSGFRRAAASTASRPLRASPTPLMSFAVPSTAFSPARTTAWSSASSTRIKSPVITASVFVELFTSERSAPSPLPGCRGRTPREEAYGSGIVQVPGFVEFALVSYSSPGARRAQDALIMSLSFVFPLRRESQESDDTSNQRAYGRVRLFLTGHSALV